MNQVLAFENATEKSMFDVNYSFVNGLEGLDLILPCPKVVNLQVTGELYFVSH